MPRKPVRSFTATSLGNLLREDGLYNAPSLQPAQVAGSISAFEKAAAKKREEQLQSAATSAAQRYLEERAKAANSQDPEKIWGHARAAVKGILPTDLGIQRTPIPIRVRTTFDAFDVNKNGFLEHRELRNALQYLGFRMDDFGAQSVLAAYDDHPDGKLDLVEFARLVADAERGGIYSDPLAAAQAQAAIVPPRVKAAFTFFDADSSGFIDALELRSALRHFGIDLTEAGAMEVLHAYDTNPDGKLDLNEFHEIIRDAQRGFVLDGSGAHMARAAPLGGGGGGVDGGRSAGGGGGGGYFTSNDGRLSSSWPHHKEEEARLENIRHALSQGEGSWMRDKMLDARTAGSVWNGNDPKSEWVRRQLLSEQEGRRSAEAEAAVAKAEAAAAIARVEALQAAAAARELEIRAAAERLHRGEVLRPGAAGGAVEAAARGGVVPASAAPAAASTRDKQVLQQLVAKLEVALLDRADMRAREDSDTARLAVLRKAFRNPMVGVAPTDRFIDRPAFLAGMGILGLPQPPAVLPARNATTGVQPDVRSDDSLNRDVLEAFFDKYKDPNGLLDYERLYARVARQAARVKHGQYKSQAETQAAYVDAMQRPRYGVPVTNGRPFTSGAVSHQKDLLRTPVFR